MSKNKPNNTLYKQKNRNKCGFVWKMKDFFRSKLFNKGLNLLITGVMLVVMVEMFMSGFASRSIWAFIVLCVFIGLYRLYRARYIYKNIVDMGVSMLLARDEQRRKNKKQTKKVKVKVEK